MTWWMKLGALDGAMKNLGPFALWWRNREIGKLETLNKAMGKLWGAKCPDEKNGKLGPWWRNWTIILLGDPLMMQGPKNDDEIGPPDDLMGEIGALDH